MPTAPVVGEVPALKMDVFVAHPEDLPDIRETGVAPRLYLTLLTDGRVAAVQDHDVVRYAQRCNATGRRFRPAVDVGASVPAALRSFVLRL